MKIEYKNQISNADTPASEILSSAKMATSESADNTLLNEAVFLHDQGVYPSVIMGEQIQKVGSSTMVRELSSWLGQSGVIGKSETASTMPNDKELVEGDPAADVSVSLDVTEPADEACKQSDAEQPAPQDSVNKEKEQVPKPESVEERIIQWLKKNRKTADIIAELIEENKQIEKPLTERQITRLVVTVAAERIKDEDGEPLEGDTALLLEVAYLELDTFKDEHGKGHGFIKSSGTNILITHSDLPKYLVYKFRKIFGRLPKPARVKEAIQILEMIAEYDSLQITLHNRVAKQNGEFYYDMGDTRSIRTTAEGWEIVKSPILFRRHSHQLPQVDPVRGGNASRIFDFLNVKKSDQLLLMVYIISLFIPGIPHPVFHPWGVRRLVTEMFGKEPSAGVHPDLAVAMGASIQAAITKGMIDDEKGIILTDVIPFSLGVSIMDQVGYQEVLMFDTLIERNQKIPFTAKKRYQLRYIYHQTLLLS